MRQFRGKTKDGKWVYGWYCQVEQGHYIVTNECQLDYEEDIDSYLVFFRGIIEVIPSTVGQSTGLHDKNGREIYEGDIVKSTKKAHEKVLTGRPPRKNSSLRKLHGKTKVIFREGSFFIKKKSKRALRFPLNSLANQYLKLEIIGDIHTNPELIHDTPEEKD